MNPIATRELIRIMGLKSVIDEIPSEDLIVAPPYFGGYTEYRMGRSAGSNSVIFRVGNIPDAERPAIYQEAGIPLYIGRDIFSFDFRYEYMLIIKGHDVMSSSDLRERDVYISDDLTYRVKRVYGPDGTSDMVAYPVGMATRDNWVFYDLRRR